MSASPKPTIEEQLLIFLTDTRSILDQLKKNQDELKNILSSRPLPSTPISPAGIASPPDNTSRLLEAILKLSKLERSETEARRPSRDSDDIYDILKYLNDGSKNNNKLLDSIRKGLETSKLKSGKDGLKDIDTRNFVERLLQARLGGSGFIKSFGEAIKGSLIKSGQEFVKSSGIGSLAAGVLGGKTTTRLLERGQSPKAGVLSRGFRTLISPTMRSDSFGAIERLEEKSKSDVGLNENELDLLKKWRRLREGESSIEETRNKTSSRSKSRIGGIVENRNEGISSIVELTDKQYSTLLKESTFSDKIKDLLEYTNLLNDTISSKLDELKTTIVRSSVPFKESTEKKRLTAAKGGTVPGNPSAGDSVPILATPGEMIVSNDTQSKIVKDLDIIANDVKSNKLVKEETAEGITEFIDLIKSVKKDNTLRVSLDDKTLTKLSSSIASGGSRGGLLDSLLGSKSGLGGGMLGRLGNFLKGSGGRGFLNRTATRIAPQLGRTLLTGAGGTAATVGSAAAIAALSGLSVYNAAKLRGERQSAAESEEAAYGMQHRVSSMYKKDKSLTEDERSRKQMQLEVSDKRTRLEQSKRLREEYSSSWNPFKVAFKDPNMLSEEEQAKLEADLLESQKKLEAMPEIKKKEKIEEAKAVEPVELKKPTEVVTPDINKQVIAQNESVVDNPIEKSGDLVGELKGLRSDFSKFMMDIKDQLNINTNTNAARAMSVSATRSPVNQTDDYKAISFMPINFSRPAAS